MHSTLILFSILPFFLEFQLPLIYMIPILIHSENEFYAFSWQASQNNSQRSSHSQDTTAFSECPAGLSEPNLTSKEQLWDSEVS